MTMNSARQTCQARINRAAFETLESRQYLSGYFDDIASKVSGPTGTIKTITDGLQQLNSGLERLPLVNKSFGSIGEFASSLETFRVKLDNTLRSLNQGTAASEIRTTLFNALAPLNVLADRNLPAGVDSGDITATVNGNNVDISFGLGISGTFTSGVGLGLDSVPFQPSGGSGANFQFGVLMPNFTFGISNGTPYFLSAQPAGSAPIEFKLRCDLPDTLHVGLGFLNFTATDAHPGDDLNVTLAANVNTSGGISSPRVSGGLDLLLNLQAQVGSGSADQGLPRLKTDFRLNWNFPTILLGSATPSNSSFGVPTLSLNNVSIELGSVLNNLIKPIAESARIITEPLQPILDVVKMRVPGVSDVSEAFGGGEVNLLQFTNLLNGLSNPPTAFINAIETVDRLRVFSATARTLAGQGTDKWINLGSFPISAPAGKTLFDSALATQIGNLGVKNWSSLVSPNGGVNFDGLQAQVKALLGNDIGGDVCALFTQLQDTWQKNGVTNGVTFDLPVVKDPAGVALGMLLGQYKDLINVRANLEFNFDKRFNFLPDPFVAAVDARGSFRAQAGVGYDTLGLAEAIAPMYSGGSFNPNRLLNGLWIDRNTGAHADAMIGITTGVGIFTLAEFTVTGGIEGNADINLVVRNGFPAGETKVRPWKGDLGGSIFTMSSNLDAFASAKAQIGFEVPIINKWIGIKKSWSFARAPLFRFSTASVPVPLGIIPPTVPPLHELGRKIGNTLHLAVGPNAGWRAGLGGIDEPFTINRVLRRSFSSDDMLSVLPGDLRHLDQLSVSAYGITQMFSGITGVVADFGNGNDVLQVNDYAGWTYYQISGGAGNDRISVTGAADVQLTGGTGDDTLDGGQGRDYIYLDGGTGNNQLSIGAGRLADVAAWTVSTFNGTVTFDNSLDTRSMTYDLLPNFTVSPPFQITGYTLGVDAGSDYKTFVWNIGTSVRILAGPGDDQFLGTAPLTTVHGGAGNDIMNPNNRILEWLTFFNGSMSFVGGAGADTVVMDNSLGRAPNISLVQDTEGQAIRWERLGDLAQLLVSGIETVKVYSTPSTPTILRQWNAADVDVQGGPVTVESEMYTYLPRKLRLHSVSQITISDRYVDLGPDIMGIDGIGPYVTPGIGHPMYVTTDGAPATAVFVGTNVRVDPAVSRAAKPWTVSFTGVSGATNRITVAAAPSDNTPASYRYAGSVLTIGAWQMPTSSLSALSIHAGGGGDTFDINSLVRTTIHGGAGRDHITVAAGAMPAMLSWSTFDGGADIDSFTLNDPGAGILQRAIYGVRTGASPSLRRTFMLRDPLDPTWWDTFDTSLNVPGIERTTINAGGRMDSLEVSTTATSPQVVHLDQNSIGAYTGDTYFGPNGGLFFNNIDDLKLNLTTAVDTVYAQPNLLAPVTLNAGSASVTSGEKLILALAAAQNRSINPTGAGAGTVTSSNLKTLTYSGFDSITNPDNVAPSVFTAGININGIALARNVTRRQSVDVQFSESIGRIEPGSIQLTNTTTGQVVPTGAISVMFDPGTNIAHFTFPGVPQGILPNGAYSGKVLAGRSNDLVGNANAVEVSFDFFILAGDANRDRKVDVADLGIFASNWQQTGRTFSQGDFNYDGTVDVADLGILASNWQGSVPMPSLPFASGESTTSTRIRQPRLTEVVSELA